MQAVIGKFYKTLKAAQEAAKKDEVVIKAPRGWILVKRSVMAACGG